MEQQLILIQECCSAYNIEETFIADLEDLGLLTVVVDANQRFLPSEQLSDLARFAEWHYDLDISPAGIDTIQHLLQKMQSMQLEMQRMRKEMEGFHKDFYLGL